MKFSCRTEPDPTQTGFMDKCHRADCGDKASDLKQEGPQCGLKRHYRVSGARDTRRRLT